MHALRQLFGCASENETVGLHGVRHKETETARERETERDREKGRETVVITVPLHSGHSDA